jgi:hypothetical protein
MPGAAAPPHALPQEPLIAPGPGLSAPGSCNQSNLVGPSLRRCTHRAVLDAITAGLCRGQAPVAARTGAGLCLHPLQPRVPHIGHIHHSGELHASMKLANTYTIQSQQQRLDQGQCKQLSGRTHQGLRSTRYAAAVRSLAWWPCRGARHQGQAHIRDLCPTKGPVPLHVRKTARPSPVMAEGVHVPCPGHCCNS